MMSETTVSGLLEALPTDWPRGRYLARMDFGHGPSPVLIVDGTVHDMSAVAPTTAHLIARGHGNGAGGTARGTLAQLFGDAATAPKLLAPIDLQCVKAAGVTFAVSALERVIEEAARGDPDQANAIRARVEERIGGGLRDVVPGSAEAAALKAMLISEGLWSQYLEVAIGPDAEVFTKAPILSSVTHGDAIGVRSDSAWNNPEPEIAILCDAAGTPIGATLGNDVNLRDFEGRSALLLGKAKDNNASCAIGPFVRLFDDSFGMDDVRRATVALHIAGEDGFVLNGMSNMNQISRDPADLAKQVMSEHQYPDGFILFLGTLFAPTQDRGEAGRGFTHSVGDVVTISSEKLGHLSNRVTTSRNAPAWDFGVTALFDNLARRGLLTGENA